MSPTNAEFGDRLDQHGNRLNNIDERLNIHAARFDKLDLVLMGDAKLGITGLVQSMDKVTETLHDLVEWRKEMIFYARMMILGGRLVLGVLIMILGTLWWPQLWPQLQVIIKLLGG